MQNENTEQDNGVAKASDAQGHKKNTPIWKNLEVIISVLQGT